MTDLATNLATILGTVLGTDLGGGGDAPPVDPVSAVIDAIGGFEDWTAESLSAGPVQTWTGRLQALVLQQATVGNRPGFTAANANFGGVSTVDFAASAHSLQSPLPAATWKWTHDGTTGITMYLLYYHSATVALSNNGFGTRVATAGTNSVALAPYATTPNFMVGKDVGYSQAIAPLPTYTAGKRWLVGRSPIASPNRIVSSTCNTSTPGTWTNTPSEAPGTLSPPNPLTIGFGTGTLFNVARLILFNKAISDVQHTALVSAFASKYGTF